MCSKSSIILGLALAVPLIAASLSMALPLWVRNGYRFYKPKASDSQSDGPQSSQTKGMCGQGEVSRRAQVLRLCPMLATTSVTYVMHYFTGNFFLELFGTIPNVEYS